MNESAQSNVVQPPHSFNLCRLMLATNNTLITTKMASLSTVVSLLFAAILCSLLIQDLPTSLTLSSASSSAVQKDAHVISQSLSFIQYASAAALDDDDDDLDQFDDDDDELDEIETINVAASGPKEFKWADTEATTFIWNLIHNHDVANVQALLLKDPDVVRYRSKDGRSALHWGECAWLCLAQQCSNDCSICAANHISISHFTPTLSLHGTQPTSTDTMTWSRY